MYLWYFRGGSRISSQGGAHLKKLCRAEGGANIFGVFRVKNHDFTPKNHIFSNFRGGAPPLDPPLYFDTFFRCGCWILFQRGSHFAYLDKKFKVPIESKAVPDGSKPHYELMRMSYQTMCIHGCKENSQIVQQMIGSRLLQRGHSTGGPLSGYAPVLYSNILQMLPAFVS